MVRIGRAGWVMRISKHLIGYLALSAGLLVSCEKNSEIKVYRVAKAPLEQSASQQQDTMPTNTAAPRMPAGLPPAMETAVTTPPNWEPQPLSQMRQASFLVKGDNGAVADVSFVSLGSAAGNVLENVNRWLGQLGQPPITDQKLGEMAQRLHTSSGDVTIVDFKGRLAIGVSDTVLPSVIDEILENGTTKILLNLSDMDYIDSNGLGELVQAFREAQRNDASLRLLKPQDRVAKTLRLTNLLPMFAVYESEREALEAFGS